MSNPVRTYRLTRVRRWSIMPIMGWVGGSKEAKYHAGTDWINAMAFVPAPNIAMVEIRAIKAGQKIENRITVDCLTTPTATILEDLATQVYGWVQGHYAPAISSDVVVTEIVATDMSTLTGEQFTYAPGPLTGGQGGGGMPNEVTLCISLRSTSRGRSARGRFFALGISRGMMADANTVEVVSAADLVAATNNLITVIEGAGYLWVIVSRVSGGVARPGGPVYFTVSSTLVVDRVVDSMRRRKPGVGS